MRFFDSLVSKIAVVACGMSVALGASAASTPFSLSFEGIDRTYTSATASTTGVLDFYNGGTSSIGTSGTNYGVSFGSDAIALCVNSRTVICSNASRGGLAPDSSQGALFFPGGTQAYMNVAAGFDTGFSLFYTSTANAGPVMVYSGLGGTGNLLGTLNLTANSKGCTAYGAEYCPFTAAGIAFAGIAHSVSFAGVTEYMAFDDLTIGSPFAIPEPQTGGLMGAGLLVVIAVARQRARRTVARA